MDTRAPSKNRFLITTHDGWIWVGNLDSISEIEARALRDHLSKDELTHGETLTLPHLRRRFEVCRGLLKVHLAKSLKVTPKEIQIVKTPSGKPILATRNHPLDIGFSISHTVSWAAIAARINHEVGIDIEASNREPGDSLRLADRFFTASESRFLESLGAEDRRVSFLRIWTAKEAVVKCTGTGIAESLKSFEVQTRPVLSCSYPGIALEDLNQHPEWPEQLVGTLAIL